MRRAEIYAGGALMIRNSGRNFSGDTSNVTGWKPIVEAAHGRHVTLVFGSKDTKHNNAVVLQRFLAAHDKTTRSQS